MRRRLVTCLAAGSIVWACAHSPAPTPVPAPRPHMPEPLGPRPEAPVPDPRLEAKLAELDRLHDWRSTLFGSRTPNPAIPARARPIPRRGRFDPKAVAMVRAYHYRSGYTNGGSGDRPDDGAEAPYASDGRLLGRVVPPEAVLTAEERDRVLGVVRAAEEKARQEVATGHRTKRPLLRCGFDDHHALVLFDAHDRPIAKMRVCFTCGEILVTPGIDVLGNGEPVVMTTEERATFQEIFDGHGLGAWTYGDRPELEELFAYERRVYGDGSRPTALGIQRRARLDMRPSGVDSAATAKAQPDDAERFCVWLRGEMWSRRFGARGPSSPTGHFECESGLRYSFTEQEEPPRGCSAKVLCDVPFERIERCYRSGLFEGPEKICREGTPAACDGLLGCLPYVEWHGP